MKTEWRIFGIVGFFLLGLSPAYAAWTYYTDTTYAGPQQIEVIGTVGLLLAASLCLMCGGYFWFVARRIDERPEDRADGEIADGAGEVGFFSPGSYWPVAIAASILITGIGLTYPLWWLVVVGLTSVAFTTSGLLYEYYSGTRRVAEH
ncbi:MAG TPA: cytochrome c oxidase subunit 4 [Micromonosporaceae bacterium]|nr:cytochrome c oxidase subunit 4 [Micromonosporaceae bacterium]